MKVGIIVTGGTIAATTGTSDDSAEPALYAPRDDAHLVAAVRELGEAQGLTLCVESWRDERGDPLPLLDSCDVGAAHWRALSAQIDGLLQTCASAVVLHGTDTLAYSAAALAMLGPRRSGTVVLTGSQIPLSAESSDAMANLGLSLEVAGGGFGDLDGLTLVAFGGRVMPGTRAHKHSTREPRGFVSWNAPFLEVSASAESNISVSDQWRAARSLDVGLPLTGFAGQILTLRVTPATDMASLARMVLATPPDGLIVELFGVGSAPEAGSLARLANDLAERGVPSVAVTACGEGALDWGRYEATAPLAGSALVSARDMSVEAAVVKLQGVLSERLGLSDFQTRFTCAIAGEISAE